MSQSIYTSSYTSVTPAYNHNDNHNYNYNGNGYHNSTLQGTATTLYQSSNVALHSIGGSASYTPIPTSGVAHSTSSAPSATAFSAAYSIHNAPQTTRPNHSTFSSSASTISGGVTTYETQQRLTGIRRAIIEPDDDPTLRPGYDPEDPFYTPVGDTLFPLLLCAVCYILIRLKKLKTTMKKLFLSLIILSMALPYLAAQTPACEQEITSSITLTKRDLTEEEKAQECGTTFQSRIAFYNVDPGALPGIFSIGRDENTFQMMYVRFSKGNLQYLPTSVEGDSVWRFANNQYDYIGTTNQFAADARSHKKVALSETETVPADSLWYDLFGFGTSGQAPADETHTATHPLSTTTDNATYCAASLAGNANDWGVRNRIFMGRDTANLWRTLTNEQWGYLINTRRAHDGLNMLYAHGRIRVQDSPAMYVNGLFLFPDGFVDIMDPDRTGYTMVTARGKQAFNSNNTFSLTQWAALEKVGVVFLPATGRRSNATVDQLETYGNYWSATSNDDASAYCCMFYGSNINASNTGNKSYGYSVRLVQDFTLSLPEN